MTTSVLGDAVLGEMILGPVGVSTGARLGEIPLDEHMTWSDEHGWTPVRERVQTSITGQPLITPAIIGYGRPLTITRCWLTRDIVNQLQASVSTPGYAGWLTLADSRQYWVRWRHEDGGIDALPAPLVSDPTADDRLMCTLRFMEIPQ